MAITKFWMKLACPRGVLWQITNGKHAFEVVLFAGAGNVVILRTDDAVAAEAAYRGRVEGVV